MTFVSFLMLSGCSGCWTPMPVVSCGGPYGERWPSIAHYQKSETIGRTDSEQRWKDAVVCGATYGDINVLSAITDSATGKVTTDLVDKFLNCMKERGYQRLSESDCGTQLPSEDTGKCNL